MEAPLEVDTLQMEVLLVAALAAQMHLVLQEQLVPVSVKVMPLALEVHSVARLDLARARVVLTDSAETLALEMLSVVLLGPEVVQAVPVDQVLDLEVVEVAVPLQEEVHLDSDQAGLE